MIINAEHVLYIFFIMISMWLHIRILPDTNKSVCFFFNQFKGKTDEVYYFNDEVIQINDSSFIFSDKQDLEAIYQPPTVLRNWTLQWSEKWVKDKSMHSSVLFIDLYCQWIYFSAIGGLAFALKFITCQYWKQSIIKIVIHNMKNVAETFMEYISNSLSFA